MKEIIKFVLTIILWCKLVYEKYPKQEKPLA